MGREHVERNKTILLWALLPRSRRRNIDRHAEERSTSLPQAQESLNRSSTAPFTKSSNVSKRILM